MPINHIKIEFVITNGNKRSPKRNLIVLHASFWWSFKNKPNKPHNNQKINVNEEVWLNVLESNCRKSTRTKKLWTVALTATSNSGVRANANSRSTRKNLEIEGVGIVRISPRTTNPSREVTIQVL
jgi:hypothetical protein